MFPHTPHVESVSLLELRQRAGSLTRAELPAAAGCQSRSAFASRKPSEIAGQRGQAARSPPDVVSIDREPEPGDHARARSQNGRRPKRDAAREEDGEEERRRASPSSRRAAARDDERDRELREDVRVVLGDVVRRPAPHRVGVDPAGSAHATSTTHESVLERLQEQPAERACTAPNLRSSTGPAASTAEKTNASDERGRRAPPASTATVASRSGSASQTSTNIAGISTSATSSDARPHRPSASSVRRRPRTRRRAPRASDQYGGSAAHQGPTGLKAFQKRVFAGCSSSAEVDVGDDERLDRRGEALQLAQRSRRAAARAGTRARSGTRARRRPSRRRAAAARSAARARASARARLLVGARELDAVRAEHLARRRRAAARATASARARRGRGRRRPPAAPAPAART